MDYKEYHEIYYKFRQSKNDLKKIQNKIEDIIIKLISINSEIKDTISDKNEYNDRLLELTAKKLDLEIEEKKIKELVFRRKKAKEEAEIELRNSKNEKDIIYTKYYIDHLKVRDIAILISYTREYTYDLLNKIRNEKRKIEKK